MAVFFKTPAPPGVASADAPNCVLVRVGRWAQRRRLQSGRRAAGLAFSEPATGPHRPAVAR